jgi:cytochrome c-type biogenesis protein CcmH/NrfF
MKEIDEYLKLLYKSLNASDQEIVDFKEEMKDHLLESVHELQAEGKSPQESIQIAIERFGDPSQINRELPKILMVSHRRFSKLLLVTGCMILVIIITISLTCLDNFKKQEKLNQAELTRKTVIQELQQSQKSIQNYNRIFEQISELTAVYNSNSGQLSKDLKAKHNIAVVDQIVEMNKTFKYHNAVLMAVAIIAADTDYEFPYYKDIAELAVMKLSDSVSVIDLAERAREAKTQGDKELVQNQIKQMKANADFNTYQKALDYNRKFTKP